jgi:hypothetical protein
MTNQELKEFKATHRLNDGTELWGEAFDTRYREEEKANKEFIEDREKKYCKLNKDCCSCPPSDEDGMQPMTYEEAKRLSPYS